MRQILDIDVKYKILIWLFFFFIIYPILKKILLFVGVYGIKIDSILVFLTTIFLILSLKP